MRAFARALLALPFVLVLVGGVAARRAVPKLGDRIGRRVSSAVSFLRPNRAPPRWRTDLFPPPSPSSLPGQADLLDPADGGADVTGPFSVRIPPEVVQYAIDDQGAHVHTRNVRDANGQAAGVRLSGVAGLKLGLHDGDVLVAIEGEPALDQDAATDLALAVVVRGRSTLHATAMRGGHPVAITAELPPAPSRKGR